MGKHILDVASAKNLNAMAKNVAGTVAMAAHTGGVPLHNVTRALGGTLRVGPLFTDINGSCGPLFADIAADQAINDTAMLCSKVSQQLERLQQLYLAGAATNGARTATNETLVDKDESQQNYQQDPIAPMPSVLPPKDLEPLMKPDPGCLAVLEAQTAAYLIGKAKEEAKAPPPLPILGKVEQQVLKKLLPITQKLCGEKNRADASIKGTVVIQKQSDNMKQLVKGIAFKKAPAKKAFPTYKEDHMYDSDDSPLKGPPPPPSPTCPCSTTTAPR